LDIELSDRGESCEDLIAIIADNGGSLGNFRSLVLSTSRKQLHEHSAICRLLGAIGNQLQDVDIGISGETCCSGFDFEIVTSMSSRCTSLKALTLDLYSYRSISSIEVVYALSKTLSINSSSLEKVISRYYLQRTVHLRLLSAFEALNSPEFAS